MKPTAVSNKTQEAEHSKTSKKRNLRTEQSVSSQTFCPQHSGPATEKQLTTTPVSRRKKRSEWHTYFHDDDKLEGVKVCKECGEQVKHRSSTGTLRPSKSCH
eukprot:snap_masked-scaffold_13-processed-gene-9.38-mRNA-1 protein AED:0.34 eAED:1.00 QI:0/0/0/1/1/1/2/0/101